MKEFEFQRWLFAMSLDSNKLSFHGDYLVLVDLYLTNREKISENKTPIPLLLLDEVNIIFLFLYYFIIIIFFFLNMYHYSQSAL